MCHKYFAVLLAAPILEQRATARVPDVVAHEHGISDRRSVSAPTCRRMLIRDTLKALQTWRLDHEERVERVSRSVLARDLAHRFEDRLLRKDPEAFCGLGIRHMRFIGA